MTEGRLFVQTSTPALPLQVLLRNLAGEDAPWSCQSMFGVQGMPAILYMRMHACQSTDVRMCIHWFLCINACALARVCLCLCL